MSHPGATVQTEALLLRSVPYQDADRIVTLFTSRLGKVSAGARSARKSRRRFGGTLEPFVHFRASLVRGRGALFHLRDSEPIRAFGGILTELDRMDAAASGLSLVRHFSPADHPEPELFADALRWLTWLEHRSDPERAALLAFCLRLLTLMGSSPRLSACGRCGREAPEGRAGTFDPGLGALVCRACGGARFTLSGPVRDWLMRASHAWLECAGAPPPAAALAEARAAMAAFLSVHAADDLGSRLYPGRT